MQIYSSIETLVKTKVFCNKHLRPFDKMLMQDYKGQKLVGVEIGVLYGTHAFSMLHHAPIEKLHLIDPFINYPGYEKNYKKEGLGNCYKQAQKNLSHFVKIGKAVFVKEKFQDALDKIPKELDFAYYDIIDNVERIKTFLALYFPIVKDGGVIGGWNYNANHSNVSKVVIDFKDKNDLELDGTEYDWWIVKPVN